MESMIADNLENKENSLSSSEVKVTSKKRRLEENQNVPTEQNSRTEIAEISVGSLTFETGPSLSSKASNKKRRLEGDEDILTEGGSGKALASTSVGSSLMSNPQSPPAKNQEKETTVSSISSIAVPATATATLHATSAQVSAPVTNPEGSSGDTAPDPILASLNETQIEQKGADIRPSKKPRLDIVPPATNPIALVSTTEPLPVLALQIDPLTKPSPFVVLPVELLSEILIYTGSPQYVLAVARTCKVLCQTLLSTTNQFIWREARRACAIDRATGPVCLPDPPIEFFGEAAYAAFVFDSGVCEVCEKATNMMYASFALRARLCKNFRCRDSLNHSLHMNEMSHGYRHLFANILPTTESNACFQKISHESDLIFYPSPDVARHRVSDLDKESAWIEKAATGAFSEIEYQILRNTKWMMFAVSLYKWKFARQTQYYDNKNDNDSQSKKFADKFGWDHSDMIVSTVYGLYHRRKIEAMEKVKETDVRVMVDQIESQLLALSERRSRHATEVAFLKNRSDVEKYYDSLRSSKVYPFLPSLPSFRLLPIINLLQSASTTGGITIAQTLQSNSLMHNLLSDQLKQWAEKAKDDFAVLLGFQKGWKNASKNVLHPVERVTARFQCIQCGVKAKDRTDDGCLNFAAACKHVCHVGRGRPIKGKKVKWDVKNFVKDEKAIQALKKIIQTLRYSEDKDGAHGMIALGLAVLCTSCDPPMIIDSRSVVGHCHRHDTMELSLALSVDKITSYLGGYPFTFGLTEQLLGPESLSTKRKEAIASKNYGCRHCLRAKQVEPAFTAAVENERGGSEEAEATGERTPEHEAVQVQLSNTASRMHDLGIEGPKEKPPPLFNFNGMISHLKAKHCIERIRDEDFLCYEAVEV